MKIINLTTGTELTFSHNEPKMAFIHAFVEDNPHLRTQLAIDPIAISIILPPITLGEHGFHMGDWSLPYSEVTGDLNVIKIQTLTPEYTEWVIVTRSEQDGQVNAVTAVNKGDSVLDNLYDALLAKCPDADDKLSEDDVTDGYAEGEFVMDGFQFSAEKRADAISLAS